MPTEARRPVLLLAAWLALAGGCSGIVPAPEVHDSFHRGHLSLGPDDEAFLPCGGNRPLQVVADTAVGERLHAQYLTLVDEPYEEAFLRLRGRHVDAGCAGCPQGLRVEQILDLQAATPGDCR